MINGSGSFGQRASRKVFEKQRIRILVPSLPPHRLRGAGTCNGARYNFRLRAKR
jgi:hypothetical protein